MLLNFMTYYLALNVPPLCKAADENNWRTQASTRERSRGAVDGKSPQFRRRRRSVGGEAYEG